MSSGGQLYMWSKVKNIGDDWVYPKPLIDLSGRNLRCMHSGNMHHFVGTKSSCTSRDHAQHGESRHDPNAQKLISIFRPDCRQYLYGDVRAASKTQPVMDEVEQ